MLTTSENDRLDAEIIRLERKSKFLLYRELEAESRKEWLVQGFLGSGEASAVYGVPGRGKSVLVEDLARWPRMAWPNRAAGRRTSIQFCSIDRSSIECLELGSPFGSQASLASVLSSLRRSA